MVAIHKHSNSTGTSTRWTKRMIPMQFSLSLRFNSHFPDEPGLAGIYWSMKDDGSGGDNWTTGAISRAKLQSNHHQQTNIQFFFTGRMPFLSPNQQCQSTEGKISHSMDLLSPSSPGGLPTLSLTTNSSWLPWGRVVMPLINPLMPVAQFTPVNI